MAYFKENEQIKQLERDAEFSLLEMLRQLDLGTEEAKGELGTARENLRAAAADCLKEIESLSEEARDGLEEVQSRLGRLNYLLAEEKFESAPQLDVHSDSIINEMESARQQVAAVEKEVLENVRSSYGKVEAAWTRFLRCMELIRMRLREAENEVGDRFAGERETLRKRLAEHPQGDENISVLTALWEGIKEHKRWIIAFFQSPLEASPTPPPPGYASTTDTSSDHGTGG